MKNASVTTFIVFIVTVFNLSVSLAKENFIDVANDSIDIELFYDNGISNLPINFQNTTGNRMATRFTPGIFPARIISARYYVADTSAGSKFLFSVLSNAGDRPSSALTGPTIISIKNLGWNEIELTDRNIEVDDDFYFSLWIFGSAQPQFGAENKEPLSLRTYDADA